VASIKKVTNKNGAVSYRVRVVVDHKPDGAPIQRMRTFQSRKEADTASRKWETDRDQGLAVDAGKVRVGEYVQAWMGRGATHGRRPSTLHGYAEMVDRFIIPRLGGMLLRDLSPAALQAWLDKLPTHDTMRRCRSVLHVCLAEAVRLSLLPHNPVDRIKAPPRRASCATAWSSEQARQFISAALSERTYGTYYPYMPLGLRLALRPSELLGLRWDAVDFDHGTITVREGHATVGHASFDGGPKSDAGKRTLDLPPDLVHMLRTHKARQNERRLALGDHWHDHNLVCTAEQGQYIGHRNLLRAFKRLCVDVGVPPIRLYDLRHTAITLMAASGADIKAISEVAGHANVLITRNVYQHINRSQRTAALASLTDALSEPTFGASDAVL
jgi:integrase